MSHPDEPTADEVLEARTGTRVPYTMVGDWVLLSNLSPQAKLLYALLAAHINIAEGDRKVWPSLETLAGWMGVKQPRSVSKYIDELVEIGALQKEQQRTADGMRTRNAYYVEGEPPAGLATPTRFSDFYAQRAADRRTKRAGQTVVQSSALRNDQAEPVSAGEDVVRSSAVRGASERQDVARSSAPEQDQLTQQDEVSNSPSTPAPPPREDVEQLCRRLRDRMIGNGCKPPTITKAWRNSARLLLDKDGRELEKAMQVLDWTMKDSFWMANVQSMDTFRNQYDKLRLKAVHAWQQARGATAAAPLADEAAQACSMCKPDGRSRDGAIRWLRIVPGTQEAITPYRMCDHSTPHEQVLHDLAAEDAAAERARSARSAPSVPGCSTTGSAAAREALSKAMARKRAAAAVSTDTGGLDDAGAQLVDHEVAV